MTVVYTSMSNVWTGFGHAFRRIGQVRSSSCRILSSPNTMRCLVQAAQRMVAGDRAKFFNALGRFAFEPHTVGSHFCEQNDFVGVIPVEPWSVDQRQAAQQTIFLAPAVSSTPLLTQQALGQARRGFARLNVSDIYVQADAGRSGVTFPR